MSFLRLALAKFWTRDSSILLSGFFVTLFLIVYLWWPLAEEVLSYIDWSGPWWLYMDWLLVGIFLFMSLTIISRANLKTDGLIVFVGIFAGLAIESWAPRPTSGTTTLPSDRLCGSSPPGRSQASQSIGLPASSIGPSRNYAMEATQPISNLYSPFSTGFSSFPSNC